MRKHVLLLITIVMMLSLTVSCNADTEHGLYYQLASSSEASNIKVSQYLHAEDSKYIYLNEKGIWSFDGTNHKLVYESTGDVQIAYGCYDGENTYFLTKSGILYCNGSKVDAATESYSKLTASGYLIKRDSLGIDMVNGPKAVPAAVFAGEVENFRESNGYLAFSDDLYTYVFKGTQQVKNYEKFKFTGFLALEDNLIFTRNKTVYFGDKQAEKLTFSETIQDNGIPMFCYDSQLCLKMLNIFKVIEKNDDEEDFNVSEAVRGWANNLATANVIFAEDGYIGTSSSGLYKIDIEKDSNKKIF